MVDSDRSKPNELTRIVLRPLGSPLPLGFFAFATGTVLLSLQELRWMPLAQTHTMAIVLLAFVAPLELLACIFAFLARDSAAGTAMGIFSEFWVAMGVIFLTSPPDAKTVVAGTFMVMDGLAVSSLAWISFQAKPLLGFVLCLSALRFFLAASVQLGASATVNLASGATGLLMGLAAVYAGAALLVEDVRQTTVLPTFRRGPAKASLEGSLYDQMERAEHDAGVRKQL